MGGLVAAIITAALVSVVGPAVMAALTARSRRHEKALDWARQDQVADRLADRQDAIAAQARVAAKLLLDANARVETQNAHTAAVVGDKLEQIHQLVNSTLTTAIEDIRSSTERELVLLRDNIELNREAGREPTSAIMTALVAANDKLAELNNRLDERAKQTVVANAQVEPAQR